MKKITVELKTPYTILIERNALTHAGSLVRKYVEPGCLAVVVTTPNIRGHWGPMLEASLEKAGVRFTVIEIKDGERYKAMSTVEDMAERMAEAGADRGAVVLALGGGVVGDMAAFLASIYMRGVDVIQIPTTLVAMIDSAVGGKTGVNLKRGKNLVGTYHQPRAVLVDPVVLSTLPDREYRSGLAEAIKYGIIRSRELFEFMEMHRLDLLRKEAEPLEWLIAECVRHKAEVVAADERESDLRRILNFGHTIGHALESATDYRHFLHGEAVAWGMIATCEMAVQLRRMDADVARRVRDAILAAVGPLPRIEVQPEVVLAQTVNDKKSHAGVLHFVLAREVGRVEITRNVDPAVVLEAIATVKLLSAGRS